MTEPPKSLLKAIGIIARFTDFPGTLVALVAIPLVGAVAYEVIARYVFHAPTTWSYDLTYMLYAAIFMLGAAYALHKGAHVRTDFFWDKFSTRTKGVIDSISYIVFFFPAFAILGYIGFHEAIYAYSIGEESDQSPWRPILWPFKAIIPLACLLLLIQGISELIKSIYAARTGIELEHKEKVEV
jgi:TRAP-type mannitol/chloroaromatic compound transport system permease small subunit